MSTIDERIVQMKFNGDQFQRGISSASKSLDDLRKNLNLGSATKGLEDLDSAAKRFSLAGMAEGVQGLNAKFIALATVGITALSNIANKAVDAGLTIVKSLTIDPIAQGLQEYETQLNAVQTILANTSHQGSTIDDVNASLNELNTYADLTIYNFSEMARNIGTFTAAGVDLDTSTAAIKGIANLAAVSGSNSQQASTAMYQLSQALAAGRVSLMDWNSVVNAGMGGKVFQDALIETARVSGVAIDDIIASSGSFRDSLQQGWLTSEILTETLSKFTGDLSEAQLQSMGYTDEQIKGILEMGQTAQDAATKVKTMSQLIETLQEAAGSGWAQTWQIIFGDFEEAKELFTSVSDVLGGMIGASADSRNAMMQDWKDLGGRTAIIDAISNAFNALMSVLKPIGEAFREIFPAVTGQQLADMSVALRDFTASLKLSAEDSENLKSTFKGLFAVMDIGWMIIKGLINVIAQLLGATAGAEGGILQITGSVGDFLVGLRNAIAEGDGLLKFFDGLGKVLSIPVALLRGFIELLGAVVGGFSDAGSSNFPSVLDAIKDRIFSLTSVGDTLIKVWEGAQKVFSAIFGFMQPFISKFSEFFSSLGTDLSSAFDGVEFDTVLDAINTGLLGGLVLLFKKFLDGGVSMDFSGGLVDSIKEVFGGLTETMSAMQAQLKAGTLQKIAIAVALLTASVVALSFIDSAKLASALTGMTVMFGQLVGAMWLLEKTVKPDTYLKMPFIAAALILLATAMLILTAAVSKLAQLSWEELAKGLGATILLLGALVGVAKLMQGFQGGLIAAGIGLILFSTAINILVSAVSTLSGMSWEELAKGMSGLAVTMGLIIGFTKLMGNPAGIIATSAALILLGAALNIMAAAVSAMGALSVESLATGLVGLAGTLAIVAGAMHILPKNMIVTAASLVVVAFALQMLAGVMTTLGGMSWEEIAKGLVALAGALVLMAGAMYLMTGGIAGAAAMIVAAGAIMILAPALQTLGTMSWEEIAKGLVMLAGSLAIIAGGLYLMTAALPGAAALLVVSSALTILVPVLQALGSMSWEQIGTGLGALALALGVIGVAGLLLQPVVPSLMGLGAAIMLLGAGAALAGAGILMLSVGLGALAVSGTAGGAALVAIITGLLSLIPAVFEQIGLGILALADVIAQGAPALIGAFVAILMALIEAINTVIPAAVDMIVNLIMKLVDVLVVNVPLLVDAGLKLITGILEGIGSNIAGVVEAAITIITEFINGIANSIPKVIQSGINLILSFINGIADGIRNNTARMNAAGRNLASAIIEGMTSGIGGGVGMIVEAARNIANSVINTIKDTLGIKSPSRVTREMGMYADQGLAQGLSDYSNVVEGAAEDVGTSALDTLRDALSEIGDVMDGEIDYDPTIRPVLDLSQVKKEAGELGGMFDAGRIAPSRSFSQASIISSARQSQTDEAQNQNGSNLGNSTVVNFTQNNNSPKPLDPTEIYRRTKNQVSVLKGVLNADEHVLV